MERPKDRDEIELAFTSKISDQTHAYFEAHPDEDWVFVGMLSETFYRGGTDAELPSPEQAEQCEHAVDEPLATIGKPQFIEEDFDLAPVISEPVSDERPPRTQRNAWLE